MSKYGVNTKSSDIRKKLRFNHAPCIFYTKKKRKIWELIKKGALKGGQKLPIFVSTPRFIHESSTIDVSDQTAWVKNAVFFELANQIAWWSRDQKITHRDWLSKSSSCYFCKQMIHSCGSLSKSKKSEGWGFLDQCPAARQCRTCLKKLRTYLVTQLQKLQGKQGSVRDRDTGPKTLGFDPLWHAGGRRSLQAASPSMCRVPQSRWRVNTMQKLQLSIVQVLPP